MKPDHDLHVHTYLSACCREKERQTPAAILSLAEDMGVHTIGFADHLWVNPDIPPSEWYRPQDESQISKLRADLAGVSTGVRVLVGCEADMIAPGAFGITPRWVETLDFVLLSCSHFHMKEFVAQPKSDSPRHLAEHLLAFFRSGVSSGLPTSIAHPFLPFGHLGQFDEIADALSDAELLDAFRLAHDNKVALEITTSFFPCGPHRRFSIETPIRILSLAKQAGCLFTFGTDAHKPEAQKKLPELSRITEALELTKKDVLCIPPTASPGAKSGP